MSLGLALGAIGLLPRRRHVYAAQVLDRHVQGGILDALWLTGYVLLAAAANHPSLLVEHPVPPLGVAIGRRRFTGLLVAALTAPALAAVRWAAGEDRRPVVASLGAGALTVLVFARLGISGRALAATIASLGAANARIRHLEGILPICASCKRIRDEEGAGRAWSGSSRSARRRASATASATTASRDQLRALE
ncbi:MAG: hypothetical protein KatS3mg065_0391 [Chloroflexota bacterium]|nr:MAG: hypothetical protein KatS3mg065_0391 [Chloroflexota bacterium]